MKLLLGITTLLLAASVSHATVKTPDLVDQLIATPQCGCSKFASIVKKAGVTTLDVVGGVLLAPNDDAIVKAGVDVNALLKHGAKAKAFVLAQIVPGGLDSVLSSPYNKPTVLATAVANLNVAVTKKKVCDSSPAVGLCTAFKDVCTMTWGVVTKSAPQGLTLSLDLKAQVALKTGIAGKKATLLCLSAFVNLNPDTAFKGLLPLLNLDLSVALKGLTGCDTFLSLGINTILSVIGDKPGTLFVPTNHAMEAAGLTVEELIKDTNLLVTFLKYHFVPNVAMTTSKAKSGVLDKVLTANLWPLGVDVIENVMTITSDRSVARCLLSNIVGDKVVIHTIDNVLTSFAHAAAEQCDPTPIAPKTLLNELLATLDLNADLSSISAMIKAYVRLPGISLDALVKLTTCLVPNNLAVNRYLKLKGVANLNTIISDVAHLKLFVEAHILPGVHMKKVDLLDNIFYHTLGNKAVRAVQRIADGTTFLVGPSQAGKIVKPDLLINAKIVVHVLDAVLVDLSIGTDLLYDLPVVPYVLDTVINLLDGVLGNADLDGLRHLINLGNVGTLSALEELPVVGTLLAPLNSLDLDSILGGLTGGLRHAAPQALKYCLIPQLTGPLESVVGTVDKLVSSLTGKELKLEHTLSGVTNVVDETLKTLNVVLADIPVGKVLVHVVDGLPLPLMKTGSYGSLWDLLSTEPQLSHVKYLLEKTGLKDKLALGNPLKKLNMIPPVNSAVDGLLKSLGLGSLDDLLRLPLCNNLLAGMFSDTYQVLPTSLVADVVTSLNLPLLSNKNVDKVMGVLKDPLTRLPQLLGVVNSVNVLQQNVACGGSIAHIVDGVLLPQVLGLLDLPLEGLTDNLLEGLGLGGLLTDLLQGADLSKLLDLQNLVGKGGLPLDLGSLLGGGDNGLPIDIASLLGQGSPLSIVNLQNLLGGNLDLVKCLTGGNTGVDGVLSLVTGLLGNGAKAGILGNTGLVPGLVNTVQELLGTVTGGLTGGALGGDLLGSVTNLLGGVTGQNTSSGGLLGISGLPLIG